VLHHLPLITLACVVYGVCLQINHWNTVDTWWELNTAECECCFQVMERCYKVTCATLWLIHVLQGARDIHTKQVLLYMRVSHHIVYALSDNSCMLTNGIWSISAWGFTRCYLPKYVADDMHTDTDLNWNDRSQRCDEAWWRRAYVWMFVQWYEQVFVEQTNKKTCPSHAIIEVWNEITVVMSEFSTFIWGTNYYNTAPMASGWVSTAWDS
jgi:hypothetical protein